MISYDFVWISNEFYVCLARARRQMHSEQAAAQIRTVYGTGSARLYTRLCAPTRTVCSANKEFAVFGSPAAKCARDGSAEFTQRIPSDLALLTKRKSLRFSRSSFALIAVTKTRLACPNPECPFTRNEAPISAISLFFFVNNVDNVERSESRLHRSDSEPEPCSAVGSAEAQNF